MTSAGKATGMPVSDRLARSGNDEALLVDLSSRASS